MPRCTSATSPVQTLDARAFDPAIAFPGVVAHFARLRHGMEGPQCLAGAHVPASDIAGGAELRASCTRLPGDDDVLVDQRRGAEAVLRRGRRPRSSHPASSSRACHCCRSPAPVRRCGHSAPSACPVASPSRCGGRRRGRRAIIPRRAAPADHCRAGHRPRFPPRSGRSRRRHGHRACRQTSRHSPPKASLPNPGSGAGTV